MIYEEKSRKFDFNIIFSFSIELWVEGNRVEESNLGQKKMLVTFHEQKRIFTIKNQNLDQIYIILLIIAICFVQFFSI